MSTTSRFSTLVFNSQEHAHLTPYLAGIHGECITSDKMIGSFMSPLSIEKMLKWWKDRIAEVTSGTRVIVMLLCSADTTAKIEAKHLVGSVMLSIPHSETSPFRGAIESLLVSSKYRGQGGASTLLQAVEEQAKIKGKTLVLAEMESGTPAVSLFKKHAYQEAGRVPGYSLKPDTGERRDVTFMYKHFLY